MNQSLMLDVKTIRIDGGTQSRVKLNNATVEEYSEAMAEGAAFPPVVVFFDGASYWLADGFHRYFGADQAGLDTIAADVRNGTQQDAQLFSFSVNADHGLRRSNADKRKSVTGALKHPVSSKWSDNQIAKHCGVHHSTVGDVRRSLAESASDKPVGDVRRSLAESASEKSAERTYTTKHGTTAVMNTTNVGKKTKAEKAKPPFETEPSSDSQADAPAEVEPEPESPSDYSELDAAKDQINELRIEVTRLNDSLAIECYDVSEEAKTEASRIIAELRGEVRSLEAQLAAVTISRDTYMQENAQMKVQMKMQRSEIEKLKSKD